MNSSTSVQSNVFVNQAHVNNTQLVSLRDQLGRTVVKAIQEISRKSFEALANYPKDSKWLNQAIWYPADYADALFQQKQKPRIDFFQSNSSFIHGFVSPDFFDRGTTNFEFIAKKGVKPSAALSHLVKGERPSLLDCGAVVQIARYQALLEVLGEEKFNRLFGKEHGQLLNIGYQDTPEQPMRYFVNFTAAVKNHPLDEGKRGNRPIKMGQVISFNSYKLYSLKHPLGMDSNFNVVCCVEGQGKQKFTAHGLPADGLTEQELCDFLAKRYNDDDTRKEELRGSPTSKIHQEGIGRSHQFKNHHITSGDVMGYDPGSPQDFNLQLIQDLIDRKLEDISIDFVRQHPEAKESVADSMPMPLNPAALFAAISAVRNHSLNTK